MQKKLLAAAVTGALGAMVAPAALAQNATVNVYGALYGEYATISHSNRISGAGSERYQRVDQWQNPGSSIGFRGEEKLGGGMSAWFQCETTMDYRGSNNTASGSTAQGICNRDSAFGLKGNFGNVFMGNWGTPFKRATNDMVGANDTGVFGAGRILYGQSSTFGIAAVNGIPGQNASPGAWRRRQSNLLAYDSPNFAGFQVRGAVTVGNQATGATSAQLKPRLWSIGGAYNNGPIAVNAAYERHKSFYGAPLAGTAGCVTGTPAVPPAAPALGAGCAGTDERAWVLAGSYTFPNRLKLGGQYSEQKADTNGVTGSKQKVKTWHVGIDWNISGPHGIRAAYSRAGDISGSGPLGAVAIGTTGQAIGTGMGNRPVANVAGGTGVQLWQIRYVYALSKRTEVTAGYSALKNKANANYEIGGVSTNVAPGSDAHAYAMSIGHRF